MKITIPAYNTFSSVSPISPAFSEASSSNSTCSVDSKIPSPRSVNFHTRVRVRTKFAGDEYDRSSIMVDKLTPADVREVIEMKKKFHLESQLLSPRP